MLIIGIAGITGSEQNIIVPKWVKKLPLEEMVLFLQNSYYKDCVRIHRQ